MDITLWQAFAAYWYIFLATFVFGGIFGFIVCGIVVANKFDAYTEGHLVDSCKWQKASNIGKAPTDVTIDVK